MAISRFEDIISWQKSRELVIDVYKLFGSSKDFRFRDQIQSTAVSVMNNIAEGFERKTNNEFRYFLFVAKGSVGEVRSMLYLAKDLNKIKDEDFDKLYNQTVEISKLLAGLISKMKK